MQTVEVQLKAWIIVLQQIVCYFITCILSLSYLGYTNYTSIPVIHEYICWDSPLSRRNNEYAPVVMHTMCFGMHNDRLAKPTFALDYSNSGQLLVTLSKTFVCGH